MWLYVPICQLDVYSSHSQYATSDSRMRTTTPSSHCCTLRTPSATAKAQQLPQRDSTRLQGQRSKVKGHSYILVWWSATTFWHNIQLIVDVGYCVCVLLCHWAAHHTIVVWTRMMCSSNSSRASEDFDIHFLLTFCSLQCWSVALSLSACVYTCVCLSIILLQYVTMYNCYH